MIINDTNTIEVKNAHGEHKETGWLDRWAKARGIENNGSIKCSNTTCFDKATDGGHVIKVGSDDKKVYIVPLCKSCNSPSHTVSFYVYENLLEYAQDLK